MLPVKGFIVIYSNILNYSCGIISNPWGPSPPAPRTTPTTPVPPVSRSFPLSRWCLPLTFSISLPGVRSVCSFSSAAWHYRWNCLDLAFFLFFRWWRWVLNDLLGGWGRYLLTRRQLFLLRSRAVRLADLRGCAVWISWVVLWWGSIDTEVGSCRGCWRQSWTWWGPNYSWRRRGCRGKPRWRSPRRKWQKSR